MRWLIDDFSFRYDNDFASLHRYANIKDPIDELAQISKESIEPLENILLHLFDAAVRNDMEKTRIFTDRLQDKFADTMTLVDLIGRKRLLMEFDNLAKRKQYSAGGFDQPVPKVKFRQAITDIVSREPRLARRDPRFPDKPLYKIVQEIYAAGHAFAIARSTSQTITERIQKAIAKSVETGKEFKLDKETKEGVKDWTKSYIDLVYRMGMSTAYQSGRWDELKNPAVREVISAMRYDSANDIDTRPTHSELDGIIASVEDPIWNVISPPWFYG